MSFIHLSFICHILGRLLFFEGQTWADGKGRLVTCPHRADSGGENGQNVRRHSLDRLHASMIKQQKKKKSRQAAVDRDVKLP